LQTTVREKLDSLLYTHVPEVITSYISPSQVDQWFEADCKAVRQQLENHCTRVALPKEHREALQTAVRGLCQDYLHQLRQRQEEKNRDLLDAIASNVRCIQAADEQVMLQLTGSSAVKLVEAGDAGRVLGVRVVFLNPHGAVITRAPEDGEVVAIYSQDRERIWSPQWANGSSGGRGRSARFWSVKANYWMQSERWDLGCRERVPQQCLFRVRVVNDCYFFESLHAPGCLKREKMPLIGGRVSNLGVKLGKPKRQRGRCAFRLVTAVDARATVANQLLQLATRGLELAIAFAPVAALA
jgi:hypothetical protein